MLGEPSCPASLSPFLPPIYLFPEWRLRRAAAAVASPRLSPLARRLRLRSLAHAGGGGSLRHRTRCRKRHFLIRGKCDLHFGMFKCNNGRAGFALPTCMKLGVRCRPVRPLGLLVGTLCSLNLFPDHKLTKEAKRGERAARRRERRTLQPPRTAGGEGGGEAD